MIQKELIEFCQSIRWNECNYSPSTCYCSGTAEKFRLWLKEKYGDLKTLGEAWYRHSYADWEDVVPPRSSGPYPDYLDWLQFRIENAYRLMRWRVQLVRALDPEHPITAHGIAGGLHQMASSGADEWRAAAEVEIYGLTYVACRKGDEPWKQWHALDLARAGAMGKPFWHAEAQAGPLWMQPQVINRPREDGRIATPEDIRLWNLLTFAGGAKGLLYPRWRPLLDGPLFGAFGAYGMDGSRTPRSQMTSQIARWANAPEQESLWKSRPVRGDIGIIVVPESQMCCYAQQGNTDFYADSARGVYQGFFDNNIQADWVHIEHIDEYALLYLPYPVMLTGKTADALLRWVENGGQLVSEGCPAYFGDRGRVGTTQPNLGLDKVFGAIEDYVEFTPDLLDDLTFNMEEVGSVRGGLYLQSYRLVGGKAAGWYEDGRIAVVDNRYGMGKTRLIGTFPGFGYSRHPNPSSSAFFASLLTWAGKVQHIRSSESRVTARLHDGEGGIYLWATNPTRTALTTQLELSERWGPFRHSEMLWGTEKPTIEGRRIHLTVSGRDAVVVRLME